MTILGLAGGSTTLTATHITAALKAAGAGSGLVMPASQIATAFNDAISKYGGGLFTTINSYAALVSECMMESAWFKTTQEYATTGPYQPYKGRTFIQITWKDNYSAFGKWCLSVGLLTDADYFVKNPTKLADLKWAAIGGVWYFTKVLKKDKQGVLRPIIWWADDPLAIGRAVNMGNPYSTSTPNGQKARDAAYKAVVAALTPAPAPTPAPPPPVVVTPPVTPEAPVIKYAPRHGAALAKYARSRVDKSYGIGWCQKFTNECGQTGSVGDWDGDKAADAEDGWKKATTKGKVVKVADINDYDAIPAGVYHYWLGGGSDHGHAAVGVGGRKIVSTDMTDAGPRYGKVGECDLGAPSRYWSVKYAGYALIEGNGYTLTDPPVVAPPVVTPASPSKPVEPAAYPTPTSKIVYVSKLNPGQKASDSVWWAQKALGVPLTGTYDAATVTAVRSFQKSLGDAVDGDLGPLQTAALFKAHKSLGVTVKDKP